MTPAIPPPTSTIPAHQGSPGEVLSAFLKLGLTSFGGPIAHLGYFREEFVARRGWIDDRGYADLVALCQFLPGPASSQVGFALGLQRAGPLGALAAFAGFTLPSAVLLMLFAWWASALSSPLGQGVLHGLKIVAVAIVAQAVWGMARTLCPDRERAGIAVAAVLMAIFLGGVTGQLGAILMGGIAGLWLCRGTGDSGASALHFPVSRSAGIAALVLFFALLIGLPLLVASVPVQGLAVLDAFYRAGALVFGGGHVVLPLLEAEVVAPGWVTPDAFLAGYGAAQAVPGPLFTFAAYLGAVLEPAPNGIVGAATALLAIFLPGFLLLVGVLPFWNGLRAQPQVRAPMAGANAAVVGILGAALYSPVWTSAILRPEDFALALVCFTALMIWKAPPWIVVLIATAGGAALTLL
jgi:chromate transporter